MNILLVDDHQLVTDGLKLLLADFESGSDVLVEVAPNIRRALALLDTAAEAFSLIITDLRMISATEGHDFIDVLRQRNYPAAVVVLSSSSEFNDIHKAYKSGANGYLLKSDRAFDILNKLKSILGGERIFPEEFWNTYASLDTQKPVSEGDLLVGGRLKDVLEMINKGYTNKEISQLLEISEHTVKFHLKKLFTVLGATNRTNCVRIAIDKGLL